MATAYKFNKAIENIGNGIVNLGTHTLKVMLVNGYTYDATDDAKADVGSVEIANGNGYTTGGATLAGVSFTYNAGFTRLDANDVVWTAASGNIGPATGAIIYSDTAANKNVLFYYDFGQSETAGEDTDFKITFNVNGIIAFN